MQTILENESSQYYIKGKELKTELTISVVSFQKEKDQQWQCLKSRR